MILVLHLRLQKPERVPPFSLWPFLPRKSLGFPLAVMGDPRAQKKIRAETMPAGRAALAEQPSFPQSTPLAEGGKESSNLPFGEADSSRRLWILWAPGSSDPGMGQRLPWGLSCGRLWMELAQPSASWIFQ